MAAHGGVRSVGSAKDSNGYLPATGRPAAREAIAAYANSTGFEVTSSVCCGQ